MCVLLFFLSAYNKTTVFINVNELYITLYSHVRERKHFVPMATHPRHTQEAGKKVVVSTGYLLLLVLLLLGEAAEHTIGVTVGGDGDTADSYRLLRWLSLLLLISYEYGNSGDGSGGGLQSLSFLILPRNVVAALCNATEIARQSQNLMQVTID